MANTISNNRISNLIESQVPFFVRNDHQNFITFLEKYYEYLEQHEGVVNRVKNIQRYYDVDLTEDQFAQKLYDAFLKFIPANILADKALLLKHIKDFYRAKGTEKSVRFLLNIMYGVIADDFYYPKKDILRVSDGKWYIPKTIRITDVAKNGNTDPSLTLLEKFNGISIKGNVSNATATVERAQITSEAGVFINELFLSNIDGDFESGEKVEGVFADVEASANISATIYGGILNTITIQNRGSLYKIGDPVIIQSNVGGSGASAFVSRVSRGNVSSIVPLDGGAGFQVNNYVEINGDGTDANAIVFEVLADGSVHPNSYNIVVSIVGPTCNSNLNVYYSNSMSSEYASNNFETFSYSNLAIQYVTLPANVSNLRANTGNVTTITLTDNYSNSNIVFDQSYAINVANTTALITKADGKTLTVYPGFAGNITGNTVKVLANSKGTSNFQISLEQNNNVINLVSTILVINSSNIFVNTVYSGAPKTNTVIINPNISTNSNVNFGVGYQINVGATGANVSTITAYYQDQNYFTVTPAIDANISNQTLLIFEPKFKSQAMQDSNISFGNNSVIYIEYIGYRYLDNVVPTSSYANVYPSVNLGVVTLTNSNFDIINTAISYSSNLKIATSFTNNVNVTIATSSSNVYFGVGDRLQIGNEISTITAISSQFVNVSPGFAGNLYNASITVLRTPFNNTSNLLISTGVGATNNIALSGAKQTSNVFFETGDSLNVNGQFVLITSSNTVNAHIFISNTLPGSLSSVPFQVIKRANIYTTIENAMSYWAFSNTGPINIVSVTQPGQNYSTVPEFDVVPSLIEPLYQYEEVTIASLGILGRLNIANPGLGYSIGDIIEFINYPGNFGIGANAAVSNVDANGAITSVQFTKQEGHIIGGRGYSEAAFPTTNVISYTTNTSNLTISTGSGQNSVSGLVNVINLSAWSGNSNVVIRSVDKLNVNNKTVSIISINAQLNTINISPGINGNLIANTVNVIKAGNGASILVTSILGGGEVLTSSSTTTGAIEEITIAARGAGYTIPPTLNLTQSGDGTATANASVIAGLFSYPGYFLNDDGQVSSYNFLEDRDYYQPFSYVIRSTLPVDSYRAAVFDLTHPAGMKLFGEYQFTDYNITYDANTYAVHANNYTSKEKEYEKKANVITLTYPSHGLYVGNTVGLEFVSGNITNVDIVYGYGGERIANANFTATSNTGQDLKGYYNVNYFGAITSATITDYGSKYVRSSNVEIVISTANAVSNLTMNSSFTGNSTFISNVNVSGNIVYTNVYNNVVVMDVNAAVRNSNVFFTVGDTLTLYTASNGKFNVTVKDFSTEYTNTSNLLANVNFVVNSSNLLINTKVTLINTSNLLVDTDVDGLNLYLYSNTSATSNLTVNTGSGSSVTTINLSAWVANSDIYIGLGDRLKVNDQNVRITLIPNYNAKSIVVSPGLKGNLIANTLLVTKSMWSANSNVRFDLRDTIRVSGSNTTIIGVRTNSNIIKVSQELTSNLVNNLVNIYKVFTRLNAHPEYSNVAFGVNDVLNVSNQFVTITAIDPVANILYTQPELSDVPILSNLVVDTSATGGTLFLYSNINTTNLLVTTDVRSNVYLYANANISNLTIYTGSYFENVSNLIIDTNEYGNAAYLFANTNTSNLVVDTNADGNVLYLYNTTSNTSNLVVDTSSNGNILHLFEAIANASNLVVDTDSTGNTIYFFDPDPNTSNLLAYTDSSNNLYLFTQPINASNLKVNVGSGVLMSNLRVRTGYDTNTVSNLTVTAWGTDTINYPLYSSAIDPKFRPNTYISNVGFIRLTTNSGSNVSAWPTNSNVSIDVNSRLYANGQIVKVIDLNTQSEIIRVYPKFSDNVSNAVIRIIQDISIINVVSTRNKKEKPNWSSADADYNKKAMAWVANSNVAIRVGYTLNVNNYFTTVQSVNLSSNTINVYPPIISNLRFERLQVLAPNVTIINLTQRSIRSNIDINLGSQVKVNDEISFITNILPFYNVSNLTIIKSKKDKERSREENIPYNKQDSDDEDYWSHLYLSGFVNNSNVKIAQNNLIFVANKSGEGGQTVKVANITFGKFSRSQSDEGRGYPVTNTSILTVTPPLQNKPRKGTSIQVVEPFSSASIQVSPGLSPNSTLETLFLGIPAEAANSNVVISLGDKINVDNTLVTVTSYGGNVRILRYIDPVEIAYNPDPFFAIYPSIIVTPNLRSNLVANTIEVTKRAWIANSNVTISKVDKLNVANTNVVLTEFNSPYFSSFNVSPSITANLIANSLIIQKAARATSSNVQISVNDKINVRNKIVKIISRGPYTSADAEADQLFPESGFNVIRVESGLDAYVNANSFSITKTAWVANSNILIGIGDKLNVNSKPTKVVSYNRLNYAINVSSSVGANLVSNTLNINKIAWVSNSNTAIDVSYGLNVKNKISKVLSFDPSNNYIILPNSANLDVNLEGNTFNIITTTTTVNVNVALATGVTQVGTSNVYIAVNDILNVNNELVRVVTIPSYTSNIITVYPGLTRGLSNSTLRIHKTAWAGNSNLKIGLGDKVSLVSQSNVKITTVNSSSYQINVSPTLASNLSLELLKVNKTAWTANSNVTFNNNSLIIVNSKRTYATSVNQYSSIVGVSATLDGNLSCTSISIYRPLYNASFSIIKSWAYVNLVNKLLSFNVSNLKFSTGQGNIITDKVSTLRLTTNTAVRSNLAIYSDPVGNTDTLYLHSNNAIVSNLNIDTDVGTLYYPFIRNLYLFANAQMSNLTLSTGTTSANIVNLSAWSSNSSVNIATGDKLNVGTNIVKVVGVNYNYSNVYVSPPLTGGLSACNFGVIKTAWAGNSNVAIGEGDKVNINGQLATIYSLNPSSNVIRITPANSTVSGLLNLNSFSVIKTAWAQNSNVVIEAGSTIWANGANLVIDYSEPLSHIITVSPIRRGNLQNGIINVYPSAWVQNSNVFFSTGYQLKLNGQNITVISSSQNSSIITVANSVNSNIVFDTVNVYDMSFIKQNANTSNVYLTNGYGLIIGGQLTKIVDSSPTSNVVNVYPRLSKEYISVPFSIVKYGNFVNVVAVSNTYTGAPSYNLNNASISTVDTFDVQWRGPVKFTTTFKSDSEQGFTKDGVYTVIGIKDTDNVNVKLNIAVSSVTITDGGLGYNSNSYIIFTGGSGAGANAKYKTNANGSIVEITITDYGSSYLTAPTATAEGSNIKQATFTVSLNHTANLQGNVLITKETT